MSLDAEYIFHYDSLPINYKDMMNKDINYLKDKYGGCFVEFSTNFYWEKPKYTLLPEEIKNLHSDQILQKKDMELWEIIK